MKKHSLFFLFLIFGLVSLFVFLSQKVHASEVPWPMFGHDAQHTGQSSYKGPEVAELKWHYSACGVIHASPTISSDDTVYVGSFYNWYLYALEPNGTLKWRYETDGISIYSSPAIGLDGRIYFGDNAGYLYALNQNGSLKWKYQTGDTIKTSPAIDSEGIIYFGSNDNYLYALNQDGSLKWKYDTNNPISSSPAIGADGTIYFSSSDNYLYALNPDGSLKWQVEKSGGSESSPAVDPDGTVYVGSSDYFLAFNPDGTEKWRWEKTSHFGNIHSPAIGADGTIYVGDVHSLLAFNPDGTLQWRYYTWSYCKSPPTIGSDGTIYIDPFSGYLHAINPDGTLKWTYHRSTGKCFNPAIGSDGTLYIGGGGGLYALGSSRVQPLSSDLITSEVMAGGTAFCYYEVLDENGNPSPNTLVVVECNGISYQFTSDNEGIVTISLDADNLGDPGDTVTWSIIQVGDSPIESPCSFLLYIIPRESSISSKLGSGINLAAAAGVGLKTGAIKGLVYTKNETDLSSASDDNIEIEKSRELEVGLYKGGSIGGGVEGACVAEASAKAGLSLIASLANSYLFSNPYGDDEEILIAGLTLASFFEGISPPLVSSMIGYLYRRYNPEMRQYKNGQKYSAGVKVSAEAGISGEAGFGEFELGEEKNNLLGVGLGTGIEGEAQLLLDLISSYNYSGGDLERTGSGVGISFSGSLDIFGGYEVSLVGSTVQHGIKGTIAREYGLVLYADQTGYITHGEISLSGEYAWGIGFTGDIIPGTDSTDTITLILTREQLEDLSEDIKDITNITDYISNVVPGNTILLGPTEIGERLQILFDDLSNMDVAYKIEEEKGMGLSFSPGISIGLGAEVKVGTSYNIEKSVSFTKEEGKILGGLNKSCPLVVYEDDEFIPSPSLLSLGTLLQECADIIIDDMIEKAEAKLSQTKAGKYLLEGIELVGELFSSKSLSSRTTLAKREFESAFGIGHVVMFSSEAGISDLSSQIDRKKCLFISKSRLTIEPGESTALVDLYYEDRDVSDIDENDLLVFQWDTSNCKWTPLEDSVVEANRNRVYAPITKLGTFTLGIPLPTGNVVLDVEPKDVDINSPQNITVSSHPIMLSTGDIVPDGTFVTVKSLKRYTTEAKNFGEVTTSDEEQATDGIQVSTQSGILSFGVSPPDKLGSGMVIVETLKGDAMGKAYFNVVKDLDSDGNGLPDYWEMGYFGNTGQDPSSDPDNDGLTNLQEYQNGTNPTKDDTDSDGMTDGWEVDNGLNPLADDANRDPDDDSYTNIQEYYANSDPNDNTSIPEVYISISPTSYDFGIVGAGSISETQTFNFFNAGILDIAIGTISITGTDASQFIIQTNDCSGETIAPSGNCTFDLIFSPTSSGTKSANLQIPTSYPGTPTLNVPLAGTAPVNTPPMADAGLDQTVDKGDIVTLDGSNSSDPDDGIASYLWTRTAGPSINLSDPTSSKPSFTAPSGGTLQFELKVTDKGGLTSTDTIIITITAPVISDGDVAPFGNRDGIVNVGDALVALRFALTLETPTQEDMAHGDVAPLDAQGKPDPDGAITVGDALVILRKSLGIIDF